MGNSTLTYTDTLTSAIYSRSKAENWPRYRLFGLTMASDYAFQGRLPVVDDQPDIAFQIVSEKPLPDPWESSQPIYNSPFKNLDGDSILSFFYRETYQVIHYPGIANFYLLKGCILCQLIDQNYEDLAALHMLPAVLSIWLEMRQEIYALHASAVVVDGKAVAFLAHTGHGKSTLAASFVQAGDPLLTDDITLIEFREGGYFARPGVPSMRLWPDEAQLLKDDYESLELIQAGFEKRRLPVGDHNTGSFWDRTTPLVCIYLVERREPWVSGEDIKIEPLSARQSIIELIRFAYAARLNEALGHSAPRLAYFSRFAQVMPIRRLVYPSGHDYLPQVRSKILKDHTHWLSIG